MAAPSEPTPHPARRARLVAGTVSVAALATLTGVLAARGAPATTASNGSAGANQGTTSGDDASESQPDDQNDDGFGQGGGATPFGGPGGGFGQGGGRGQPQTSSHGS